MKDSVNSVKSAEIYLAGGCFWGTEHFMKQIRGVIHTEAGYANSHIPFPDYKQVCSGETGAAETVKVVYNPDEVSLTLLLRSEERRAGKECRRLCKYRWSP